MKSERKRTLLNYGVLVSVVTLLILLLLPRYSTAIGELPFALPSEAIDRVIKALFVLAAGCVILSTTHHLLKKMLWKVLAFLALFVYGVTIYRDVAADADPFSAVLAPVDHTLSIFFPSRGGYGETGLDRNSHYYILHLLSYLYFAMIVFSIWGRRLLNRNSARFVATSRKNMFWGYSDGGMMLAHDILSNTVTQQVVFVLSPDGSDDEDGDRAVFERIDRMGAIAIYKNLSAFRRAPRAFRHFFLTEDQDFNVKAALRLIELLKGTARRRTTHLYVRTEMERIDRYFTEKLADCPGVEVHLFNQSDLTARRFVGKFPMTECPGITVHPETARVSGTFNLLLLGFGWTGYEVLKKCVCDAQFVGSRFEATVIDADYDCKHGKFSLWLEEAIAAYRLTMNPEGISDVGGCAFFRWADRHLTEYNRVIVALGDDALNIEVALTLSKMRLSRGLTDSNRVIFAHVRHVDKYDYYKEQLSPITIFGHLSRLYSQELLINEQMDVLAKAMNLKYSGRTASETEAAWHAASVFDQDSSRAAASGIRNTLRLLGYEWADEKQSNGRTLVTRGTYAARVSALIETLAETEHKRWCAFHFMAGIRLWPTEAITYDELKASNMRANQIGRCNRHAALLPYAQLPELDRVLNGWIDRWNGEQSDSQLLKKRIDNQENDRCFVRDVPDFLAAVGWVIVERKAAGPDGSDR